MKLKLSSNQITLVVVILFVVAGIIIILLDWQEMRTVIGRANWLLLTPALLFTAISYASLSYIMAIVFRAFNARLKMKDLLPIGFVSSVLTYLINIGGVTGVSLQVVLMKRRGLAMEDILAPSLFQLYFSSLMLVALLPIGLFNIIFSHHLSGGSSLGIGIAAGILTVLLICAGFLVFATSVRLAVFHRWNRAVYFVTRRDVSRALADFHTSMTRGVTLIRQRPVILILLIILSAVDWGSNVTALWFCFNALGNPIDIGTLLTGFSLGITAGFVSMVPGGLGIQEGSMAGIYALFGVPLGTAVLGAILFRIVYYFIPFFASLGFYRRLLRESR